MITEITNVDNTILIKVIGRLDTLTSKEFDNTIQQLDTLDNNVVLDCGEMEYISSVGLRSLISLLKAVKSSGHSLEIKNLTPAVRPIFDMTGFSTLFNIK